MPPMKNSYIQALLFAIILAAGAATSLALAKAGEPSSVWLWRAIGILEAPLAEEATNDQ